MSKVWLITGSSRGIGRALCEAVLANGDRLVATALPNEMERLHDLLARFPQHMITAPLDVTCEDQAAPAIQVAIDTFGRLDVVVNNAGYGNVSPIEDTSMVDIRRQIETNLFGCIGVTKAALPIMRQQRSGHFIQFSSVSGRIGPAGRGAYAAAKWGVEGFSESLFREVAPLGIRVTIIEPGGFRTDFAGASTTLSEGGSDYAETVGKTVEFQRAYNGNQPGDPAKAAAALVHVAGLDEPPLRLLLGSDAYALAEQNDIARLEDQRRWRDLSVSTDFEEREQDCHGKLVGWMMSVSSDSDAIEQGNG